jgi:cytidine deaminase
MGRVPAKLWDRLAEEALIARRAAYAPYSRFRVGAALLTEDGTIIHGCNVENASFGLCLCAERNALTTAVAAGHRAFRAMAIATGGSPPSPPCGMCLQFMAEFCEDLALLLVNRAGERRRVLLGQLMTRPFRWKGAGTATSIGTGPSGTRAPRPGRRRHSTPAVR